jgi:hypothetical protein
MKSFVTFFFVLGAVAQGIESSSLSMRNLRSDDVGDAHDQSSLPYSTPDHRKLASVQGQVTTFRLINADTDQPILDLKNNIMVNLGSIPNMTTPSFNIHALVNGTDIQSVRFGYNNITSFRTENVAPFAFCGNDKSNFFQCNNLGPGTHTVTATPRNSQGQSGRSATVKFTIVAATPMPPTKRPTSKPLSSPTQAPQNDILNVTYPFLTLISPDPLTFSPLVKDICVQVTNTKFNPSNVTFSVNSVARSTVTFKNNNTVACLNNFSLSNGLNNVNVKSKDSTGLFDLTLSRDVWAGASTVNVRLVDNVGLTFTGNATVVAALSDNELVVATQTTCK